MEGQMSLFGQAEPARPSSYPVYASVVLDIPSRALSEPFTYGVPVELAEAVDVGTIVLVSFAHRDALGYVVRTATALADLSCNIEPSRVLPIRAQLGERVFTPLACETAAWISREYVSSLAESLRLFLPPGGTPRLVKREDGYHVERPAVVEARERVVSLMPDRAGYQPPKNATRQKQLLEALSCGPVSTRELNALYTDLSGAIRTLAQKGVVRVDERRVWRGCDSETTLSSARAQAPVSLTAGQRAALEAIARVDEGDGGGVVLVDGVTGSGKTEVYLSAIERVIARGQSACVLVPEISLTAQTVGRFRSRFGGAVAVFHSRLSAGERLDQWEMVRRGDARVVVGARSALFCPFRDLGLIVIDEEHEQSYKQGSSPRYHAREVAVHMAATLGIPLVLGSATPSAESLERCRAGEFGGVPWVRTSMPERPGTAVLPEVVIADLRREFAAGSRSIFSRPLHDALLKVAERGEKAVLLHNRRGFAPFLMCRDCGCVPTCRHCSTALTYHERTHTLECHTCGRSYHVRPYPAPGSACPKCGSRYLAKMGLGTQQVEDALAQLLPEHVQIIRMDADSTKGKEAHKRLLEQFDAAPCAVLVGTQMIAKGLDFPEVTLAAVINADYALKMPDFRAQERAFDLLEQVAGRAGRGDLPGKVIIQTYLPEDPVIRAVARHDRAVFTDYDREQRLDAQYPPFVRLTNVLIWGPDKLAVERYASELARSVRGAFDARCGAAGFTSASLAPDATRAPVVIGPASCVVERAKDRYRFHFMVKSPLGYHVSQVISDCLAQLGQRPGINVSVDVDAYDVM